jgi:hypothetical protein
LKGFYQSGLRYQLAANDANALLKIFALFALNFLRTLDQPELEQNFQREEREDFQERRVRLNLQIWQS